MSFKCDLVTLRYFEMIEPFLKHLVKNTSSVGVSSDNSMGIFQLTFPSEYSQEHNYKISFNRIEEMYNER